MKEEVSQERLDEGEEGMLEMMMRARSRREFQRQVERDGKE